MNDIIMRHDPTLVLVALATCVAGCHAAFRMLDHARHAVGTARIRRSVAAGCAAGAAIWATHFLAMLALSKSIPMEFDIGMTIASIIISMTGASLAVTVWTSASTRTTAAAGGALLAGSISAMHFVGMSASSMAGQHGHHGWGVAASIAAGTALSVLAALVHRGRGLRHVAGTMLLAAAVAAIHFGSMASMVMGHAMGHGQAGGNDTVAAFIGVVVGGLLLLALTSQRLTERMDVQRQQADERIAHVASHDPLTGLPNRSLLSDRLGQALARSRREGTGVSVLYLDLDGFKAVNDQFGHGRGDDALREVAKLVSGCIRETDTLARMGGDEFVIVQEDVAQERSEEVCSRILDAMREAYAPRVSDIQLGISIGVASAPRDARDAEELIRMADIALYRAKAEGRGTARFFEQSMDEAAKERRAFEADLRMALARGELSIVFQPQMGAEDGRIHGFEVLARWTSPTRGSVPPDRFIPIAERMGTIVEIGDWVLERSCREAASWERPLRIAVNLSAVQIASGSLVRRVREILRDTGLDAGRLELEVTETAILRDQELTLAVLQDLKALGVKIAMDDFGTGYSSLSSLHSFPFDKIKVDKSFVSSIETDGKASSIVKAVIGLGRSLDLPIVAEGVENQTQLDLLKHERCTEIQGYLVGRPLPADAWTHLTRGGRQDAADAA